MLVLKSTRDELRVDRVVSPPSGLGCRGTEGSVVTGHAF